MVKAIMYLKLSVLIMCEWKEIEEKFLRMKKKCWIKYSLYQKTKSSFYFQVLSNTICQRHRKPSDSLMIIYGRFTTNNLNYLFEIKDLFTLPLSDRWFLLTFQLQKTQTELSFSPFVVNSRFLYTLSSLLYIFEVNKYL